MSTVFFSLASFAIVWLLGYWAITNIKDVLKERRCDKESKARDDHNIYVRLTNLEAAIEKKQDKK